MKSICCYLLLLYVLFNFATAGKEKRKAPKARQTLIDEDDDDNTELNNIGHEERSLHQWYALLVESLRLICNTLKIPSRGSTSILAQRLYNFYQPPPTITMAGVSIPDFTISSPTTSFDCSRLLPDANYVNDIRKISTTSTAPSVPRLKLSKVSTAEAPLTKDSLRAELMSLLPSLLQQANQQNSQSNARPNTTSAGPAYNTVSYDQRGAPFHQDRRNCELMPPLPESVISKIKLGKFVEFDTLLTQPRIAQPQRHDFDIQVGNEENPSVSLVPRPNSKARIPNFESWMLAWCVFSRIYF